MALPWGMFGENLSPAGLLEEKVRIGDESRIGTTRVHVTEPRMPCYKLGIRFGRPRFTDLSVTEITRASAFYAAEDYHQDYYLKNPLRYKLYRYRCGRDKKLKQLWGETD